MIGDSTRAGSQAVMAMCLPGRSYSKSIEM